LKLQRCASPAECRWRQGFEHAIEAAVQKWRSVGRGKAAQPPDDAALPSYRLGICLGRARRTKSQLHPTIM
jgi:hypothetical protein